VSANTVTITLTAKDGVSKVFTQIARDGESMGAALKKAATDAERGLDDLGDSAQQAQRPLRDLKDDAKNLGLGIGVLVSGMALAGKSFRDQEIALESMRRGYGDTAAEMERFAEQIQDTTNYSNDAAIASENIFRTLALNYQFSAEQIQQLITISADLAASMGIGLEDAAMRVQAAMRGEAESAEYLGLTLNDTALGIDNMAKSTTDAEKAQIRFNALQEQSAFAMGMAQQQADTTYGTMTQLRDSVQDAAQSFGDFLGPLGEVGAFAADNVIQLAAMGLALGQVGSAAKSAHALMGAQGLAGTLMKGGVWGLAIGAGIAGIALLANALKNDLPEASDEAVASVDQLIEAVVKLGQTSSLIDEVLGLDDVIAENNKAITDYVENVEKISAARGELLNSLGLNGEAPIDAPIFDDLNLGLEALKEYAEDGTLSVQELDAALKEMERTAELAEDWNTAFAQNADEIFKIITASGEGAEEARTRLTALFGAIDAGLSPEDFGHGIDGILEDMGNVQETALLTADAVTVLGGVLGDVAGVATNTSGELGFFFEKIAHGIPTIDENRAAWEEWQKQVESQQYVNRRTRETMEAAGLAIDHVTVAIGTAKAAIAGTFDPYFKAAERIVELNEDLAASFDTAHAAMNQAATALDDVFRGIVGNTDAIAQQSQGVMDWAENLIAAEGAYGKIDDLLRRGEEDTRAAAISQEEYNAAQAAYYDIADANLRIQEDVLSIQAQLAPYVATATEALAEQMDQLAGGSTDAQLFALGMMDAATSSQALALAQAYIGDQDTFGPMLVQAAELNPMLAQILEEMGLISYNPATGEVRLLGADEAQSEIALLTDAMEGLNETVATLIAILQDDASGPIGDVQGLADALGITVATPTAVLNDLATGPLYAIQSLMGGLDGMTATTYVQTVYESVTSDTRFGAMADGGVIPAAAMGRVLNGATLVGEHGPELLLGGEGRGGMVVPATASSRTGNGWGGDVVVNVYGNVGVDDLTEQITAKLVPALQRAVGINNAAYGGFA